MDTSEFIRTLAADRRRPETPLPTLWWAVAGLAITFAATAFFAAFGPRPDIAGAAETYRFLFKILVAMTLAVSAFACIRTLSRPGGSLRKALLCLAPAPVLTAMAVAVELSVLPSDRWSTALIGTNIIACLVSILLLGIGPLAIFLKALRHGAPTRPAFAGAAAGLLAGGIAATFYAIKCPNDSPLFVATWYTIAIAILAILGSVGARRMVSW